MDAGHSYVECTTKGQSFTYYGSCHFDYGNRTSSRRSKQKIYVGLAVSYPSVQRYLSP